MGPQGSIGLTGLNGLTGPQGTRGQDAESVDPVNIKRDVIRELSLSPCSALGTRVNIVTDAAVSPFDTFGRPSLNLSQQFVCVLR